MAATVFGLHHRSPHILRSLIAPLTRLTPGAAATANTFTPLSLTPATSVIATQTRGAKSWYPDAQYLKQYEGTVLFPAEAKWEVPMEPWNDRAPPFEKHVRNM